MKLLLFILFTLSKQSECDFGESVVGKYSREMKKSENTVFTTSVTAKKGKKLKIGKTVALELKSTNFKKSPNAKDVKKTFEKILKDSNIKFAKKTYFVLSAKGTRKSVQILSYDKIDRKNEKNLKKIHTGIQRMGKCKNKESCKEVVSGQCKHKTSKNGKFQLDVKLQKFIPGFHYVTWSGKKSRMKNFHTLWLIRSLM